MFIYFRACEKQNTISYVTRFENTDKTTIIKKCWNSINSSINNTDTLVLVEDSISEETKKYILNSSNTNNIVVVPVPEHEWSHHLHTITLIEILEKLSTEFPDKLHYIVEDDYLHVPNSIRILQTTLKDWPGFAVSYDYPDRYVNVEPCSILLGPDRHWRTINSSTMTAIAKGSVWLNYISKLKKAAPTSNDKVFEEIYRTTACLAPIPSLSAHLTDKHLSPFIDWKALWQQI